MQIDGHLEDTPRKASVRRTTSDSPLPERRHPKATRVYGGATPEPAGAAMRFIPGKFPAALPGTTVPCDSRFVQAAAALGSGNRCVSSTEWPVSLYL